MHARSKMKARRSRIVEEDSTECSETAFKCRISSEEWAEMEPEEAETNDEWPSAEGLRPSEWRSSAVPAKDLMEEAEEQEGDTEVETLSHDRRPPREQSVYTLSGHEYFEVPEELANTAVDPNSMKELIDQVVEDVERTTAVQQPMPSGQVSSGTINLGCDEGPSAEKPRSAELSAAHILDE